MKDEIDKNMSDSESNNEVDDNNLLEENNNILKVFDDQNREKLNALFLEKKNIIKNTAKNIKCDIKNLAQVIQDILERQHQDYLNTFYSFMDSIRKELTQKLEQMEKIADEKNKANDIRVIKYERDFFRAEAVRLNGICKSFKEKIDEITFNNKLLTDELNTLTTKWKESENINKQLLFELESNIQSHKELEQQLSMTKSVLSSQKWDPNNSQINNQQWSGENGTDYKTISYNNIKMQDINNLEEKLRKSKTELKKEKERANKALVNLNKLYLERNKLEGIFQNCVEETKKIIFNRRIKENKGFKIKNKTGIGKYDYKVSLSAKFEEFLPSDKKKTLENFIFNEEVFNVFKDIIFSKPKKNNFKSIEDTKSMINSYKFLDPDWKLKEVLENVNDNNDNSNVLPMMPINKHGRVSSVDDKNINNNDNERKANLKGNFYKTGRMNIRNKNVFGSTSRLSMNLQI